MKLGKTLIKNFGAYKELEFDFSNQGLSLISGPTKAGKSTVFDAACWLLYGVTSKDSASDDMHSWFTDEPTEGFIEIQLVDSTITVVRIRGKASQNDLYWLENNSEQPNRGKDLKDTQRLLEDRLGVSSELYIIGSYMHQFSNADTFFVAKAKDRREVLEKLADLSLPIKLGVRASECRKEKKKELEELNQQRAKFGGSLEQVIKTRAASVIGSDRYEAQRAQKLLELQNKSENFENERRNAVYEMVSKIEELSKIVINPDDIDNRMNQIKTQIKSLEQAKKEHLSISKKFATAEADRVSAEKEHRRLEELQSMGSCPTCTAPVQHNNHFTSAMVAADDRLVTLTNIRDSLWVQMERLEKAVSVEKKIHMAYDKCRDDKVNNDQMIREMNELKAKVTAARTQLNRYHEDIENLESSVNPYHAQIESADKAIEELQLEVSDTVQYIKDTEHLIASLTWLYDKSFELRANMLERAKNELANKTNAYLEKYFDAELRISLSFEGSDKLNVEIMNEGYACPYKQLSGGERCMLKLAFNLSLMKRAEDVAGVKFSTIMLDEALNGLDASLKTKAFNLLQSLEDEYDTILLIDHFELFQELFTNRFIVDKENGYSVIRHE